MTTKYIKVQGSYLREELETAWLRGYVAGGDEFIEDPNGVRQAAADYAERVVGGFYEAREIGEQ